MFLRFMLANHLSKDSTCAMLTDEELFFTGLACKCCTMRSSAFAYACFFTCTFPMMYSSTDA